MEHLIRLIYKTSKGLIHTIYNDQVMSAQINL